MSEDVVPCRSLSDECRWGVGGMSEECWNDVGVMSYVGEISEVLRNLGLTVTLFSVFQSCYGSQDGGATTDLRPCATARGVPDGARS
jgi:hypothetical protein